MSYKQPFQSQIPWFSQLAWGFGEGGGEELRLQSREGQELSASAAAGQLILKMSSEDQTVNHRISSWGTITARSSCDFEQHAGQEDTNFVNSAQNTNGFAQSSD